MFQAEVIIAASPKMDTTCVPPPAPWGSAPPTEKTMHQVQESHQPSIVAHPPQSSRQTTYVQHSQLPHASNVPHSQQSPIIVQPPYSGHAVHTPHSVSVSQSSHLSHAGQTHHCVHTSHAPHGSHAPHSTHVPHTPHSVHFSDLSYSRTGSSHPSHLHSVSTPLHGQVLHTAVSVPQSSPSIHHGARTTQATHPSLLSHFKHSGHPGRPVHHSHATHSPREVSQIYCHSGHVMSTQPCPSHTLPSTSPTRATHTMHATQLIHHVHHDPPIQPTHAVHSVPSLQTSPSRYQGQSEHHVMHTSHPIYSVEGTQHLPRGQTTQGTHHERASHSHYSGHPSHATQASQCASPAQAAQSARMVQHSQPTVWRHSWTEGEAKEQRVWMKHESGEVPGVEREDRGAPGQCSHEGVSAGILRHVWEAQSEGRSEDNLTTGELTSLLKRFERRTPSEQSLLVAERDEDTLI
ncbi:hypothetical protein Hamer_G017580 [Homarus americanus]|uniref:Uncharacterized protein n=1 Tax=Homarus americanus TaxID=6706 RepID=A0A8J5JCS1_HOMAM|nr:hypothetical protein Hamer_G017580 [Homarus americanus]